MYSFNLASINGQASAYVFCSLFNPSGSGKTVLLQQVQVTPYAATDSTVLVSTQLARITAASGGTLTYDPAAPTNDVVKLQTSHPDSVVEIRTANPTVTAGGVIGRFAPPIQQSLTSGTYTPSQQEISFAADQWGLFTLEEGEGVAFRQTSAGSTNHRWPFTIAWSE